MKTGVRQNDICSHFTHTHTHKYNEIYRLYQANKKDHVDIEHVAIQSTHTTPPPLDKKGINL